jgi:PTS system nitrogen regulatory IIA component
MDLKIKDVAQLLSVSETTIRRWLKDGKIPAYQLNRQYRFNRTEIEDWMLRCKLNLEKDGFSPFEDQKIYPQLEPETVAKSGTQQFSLYRAMHKGGALVNVACKNKKQLFQTVMQALASRLGLDPDVAVELLLDREALMSTALNSGIAVPHPRDIILEIPGSDAVITVFPEKPLDFEALDGQPVHTLFFLFSSSDKTHLHLLSKLAHFVSQPQNLKFLASKPSLETLLSYIKEWEIQIRHQIYTTPRPT